MNEEIWWEQIFRQFCNGGRRSLQLIKLKYYDQFVRRS